jgi:predicted RNase H-like nuclease (RuvC/YqgF family)
VEQTLELRTKNDAIETLKKFIEEETKKISTLQTEITSVKVL